METNTKTLFQTIFQRAEKKATFAVIEEKPFGYNQLLDNIQRMTTFFRKEKIDAGSRVIIVSQQDQHAITFFLAALLDGLCPILLSPDTRSERAQAIFNKAEPRFAFIDKKLTLTWLWLHRYPHLAIVGQIGSNALLNRLINKKKTEPETDYPGILKNLTSTPPACDRQPKEPAFITFTSGTTADPKGVIQTHHNLFSHLETLTRVFDYDSQSRILNNMILAHNDGLVQGPLVTAFNGATLYRPEAFSIQNMETLLNGIYREKITHFLIVPTVLALIDRFISNNDYFDVEHFRYLISTADKVDPHLWRRLEQRFGIRICNIYGLTETVAGGLFCGPHDDSHRIGTVGKPVDMEIKIVNENGSESALEEAGELWLKGDNVSPGYFNNPKATQETFEEGWLKTGDIACLDNEGFVQIVGRKKAVIISGGFNIHPDEVNEALRLHESVNDVATLGLPDEEWGEIVVSVVESSLRVDETALFEHCRKHLETQKVPKQILYLEQLPRGLSGKVNLPKLRQWIEEQAKSVGPQMTVTETDLFQVAGRAFKTSTTDLGLQTKPADLPGWDSLGHIQFVNELEEAFNIRLEANDILAIQSLKDALHIIQRKTNR